MNAATLLRLVSITKSFRAVRALKGVSFDLRAGEVHALLGENGAGKSTLIKIITGANSPDGGTIEIDERPVTHLTPATALRLGIACIYQQPALFPELTVAENIALRLEPVTAFRRLNWFARRARAAQLLDRIGAHIPPDAAMGSLSMPLQQLVEIACAIGARARIVIMDEPTASLTKKEVDRLFAIVRELRQQGTGIIYISHRLDEIFELADRVTVLRDGESMGTRFIQQHRRPDAPPLQSSTASGSQPVAAGSEKSASNLTPAELIRLMIGREVTSIFPAAEGEPGDVVLSLEQVGCTAAGVRQITLEVRAGEIIGFAGLVGAGRTALAQVLFGITPADSGRISRDGRTIRIECPRDAIAHGIAYVPEDRRRHGVILDMSIAENMTMAIHDRIFPACWLRDEPEQRLAAQLTQDLDIRASGPDAAGHTLSGGNQQKVSLARWLAANPQVLILDEPTQGVDIGAKAEIHKIIRRLTKAGMAVILISSDLPEVIGMSDRIAVMRGGTIVAMMGRGSDAHELLEAALGQPSSMAGMSSNDR
ncbi:MAG: rhamnose transport system ATP-binding protein [Verrucomicrobiota bacterium]|jgi:rhamnose transport system ATP-binding protein